MQIIHYTSYAKVNLGLHVLNKKSGGYHNIHSFFIEINLTDELIFTPSSNYKLSVDCNNNIQLPLDGTNLISQAYELMQIEAVSVQHNYDIHLKKMIPIGSGLGGGSSNAATTIKALNELWKLNLHRENLEILGAKLGADVPFFIGGGFQLAEGIGEKLTPQDEDVLQGLYFLLVIPSFHIFTAEAYRSLNKPLSKVNIYSKFSPVSKPVNWKLFDNDFEKVILKAHPEIGDIKKNLLDVGALYAGLSGSGSTVYGVFDNLHGANSSREYFSRYQTFIASPVFHS